MKAIYYRLKGDRRYFNSNELEVIKYAVSKYHLTASQESELVKFGTTQDEKYSIIQFASK
jgi:hypothetical protein